MKILILGGSGLTGQALLQYIHKDGHIQAEAARGQHDAPGCRYSLDISQPGSVDTILNEVQPDWVVSALRGDFPTQMTFHRYLADQIAARSKRLMFCSTTNVFDSDRSRSHTEADPVQSVSDYGRFKSECEVMLESKLGKSLCIVRLPQLWGPGSQRAVELQRLLSLGQAVPVWPLLKVSAIPVNRAAECMIHLMRTEADGVVHLTAGEPVNHDVLITDLALNLGYTDIKLDQDHSESGWFSLSSIRENLFEGLRKMEEEEIRYRMVL